MAYKLEADESVESGVKRIAKEQVQRAIDEVDDGSLDAHVTVHQVRKRCKKVRGLLRLARPGLGNTYREENSAFRDAARRLSPIRDAEAILETYDELIEIFGEIVDQRRFRPIRTVFEHRKDEVEEEFAIDERLSGFRDFCEERLESVECWELEGDELSSLAGGLRKTYRRGRRAFHDATEEQTAEAFHEWRKRVKYHWYHTRILRDVWPPVVRARRDELDKLSDLLGDEHDLAVMQEAITCAPHEFAGYRTLQALIGLIERRRIELRSRATLLGDRLYAEKPSNLASRFETYLEVWKRRAADPWPAA